MHILNYLMIAWQLSHIKQNFSQISIYSENFSDTAEKI